MVSRNPGSVARLEARPGAGRHLNFSQKPEPGHRIVKGHRDLPGGGHAFSRYTDSRIPGERTAEVLLWGMKLRREDHRHLPSDQIDHGHWLVAARAEPADAEPPAEPVTRFAALGSEVPGFAVGAVIHGVLLWGTREACLGWGSAPGAEGALATGVGTVAAPARGSEVCSALPAEHRNAIVSNGIAPRL